MPFYYDVNRSVTTNATANTETGPETAVRTGTGVQMAMMAFYGSSKSPSGTSLAGVMYRVKTFATANTVGTAITAGKRNANSPTAVTGWFSGATTGTTATVRMTIGMSAPGGAGGWMAVEPDAALQLQSGGGANGNLEVFHIAGIASIVTDYTVDFADR